MLRVGESPAGTSSTDIPLTQDVRPKRATPSWQAGLRLNRQGRSAKEAKHCRSGAGSALWSRLMPISTMPISKRPVEPERDIEARVVLEIVAGESARQPDLHGAEIHTRIRRRVRRYIPRCRARRLPALTRLARPAGSRAAPAPNIPGTRCRRSRRPRETCAARDRASFRLAVSDRARCLAPSCWARAGRCAGLRPRCRRQLEDETAGGS
jgi:hypothetical protein